VTTETLEYVRLGMTELSVSPIAFGTWELGGEWGSFDEQKGVEAIRNAREETWCFVRHEDEPTAPAYAQRLVELAAQ